MARKNSKTAAAIIDAPIVDTEFDAMAQAALEAEMIAEIEATAPDLSFIDESMETAAVATIVDHGSHIGYTWVSPELANEVLGPVATMSDNPATDFETAMASHEDDVVTAMVFAIKDQVDAREAFETIKNPENTNIQRTLKKVRSQLVTKRAARVMLTAGTDPSFINRVLHDGSRYNVYALGKFADVVFGLTGGIVSNAINLACLRSLFACAKAEIPFTQEVARAAASNKIHIDPAIRKHLTRHTVSASTAPTQASSTMQALATLNVVSVSGSQRSPVYAPAETPICAQLAMLLAA